jgi:hypothetical protein
MDFLFYLIDQENENQLWDVWLHKETDSASFAEFKKKYYKSLRKPKAKTLSKESEKELLDLANSIIKPVKKGGEKDG